MKEHAMATRFDLAMIVGAALVIVVPSLASAQELGKGGSVVSGGAGPDGAQNASAQAEKCDAPKGTLAVVEPQSVAIASLSRYGLGSPSGLIRLIIQQSNCFQIVERGAGMQNMMQERALAQSGEMQSGSNVGKGQMVAADFIVTPNVVFTDNNAGGVGGSLLGALGGRAGAVLGGIAGGLKFKQAQTSMLLVDARSGIQVAAAEGSAQQTDFALGGALFGGGAAAAATRARPKARSSRRLSSTTGTTSCATSVPIRHWCRRGPDRPRRPMPRPACRPTHRARAM
jgi:hypothetical protein